MIRETLGPGLLDPKQDNHKEAVDIAEPGDLFEDEEEDNVIDPIEPETAKLEADDHTAEAYDEYLNMSVLLPRGG